ncbi:MAG: SpoIIE family protein phosphatase [Bacteroidales bacterium]|nr:SpoIIE family protein phosphatase [Bacteroidales bacterium]
MNFSYISKGIKAYARAGLLLVVVAALSLEATAVLQYYYSRKGIRNEAVKRAESQISNVRLEIMDVIDQAEAAVRNSVWIAGWCLDVPDSVPSMVRRIVNDNPEVDGSTMAFMPGFDTERPLFAPYAYRYGNTTKVKTLATDDYDYPSHEWFTEPVGRDTGYWSEPYIDEGGGEMLMTTYSVPVKDKYGRTAAVLTADISLDWINSLIDSAQVYSHSFGIMLSREGRLMACSADTLGADMILDKDTFSILKEEMLKGTCGNMAIKHDGRLHQVFFAPVEHTGWSTAVIIPEDEIYAGIRRVGLMVKFLQLLGLAMLVLILRSVGKNQLKYQDLTEKKERMESELRIGHDIQQSMIPHTFPPFPERRDLDMSACLVPAKEVGGDLFDFYIRDEKLWFCIGDVSGKGVPASLLMAVTRSLFRSISMHEDGPGVITSKINEALSETNENNMFVTFFCGALDLATGQLRYCNAGHNPPLILSDRIRDLEVHPNLPLGIASDVEFQEQEEYLAFDDAVFLYTDGVTEAENITQDQFGQERMEAVLHTRRSARGHLEAMQEAISAFVGEAPRSDDITMLFIHYLDKDAPASGKRHIVLRNQIKEIERLAVYIDGIVEEMHIDSAVGTSLNLALEEAVTNVILYAYPEGKEGLVDIVTELGRESLTFTISDRGTPFDPTAMPEVNINAGVDERRIGGLGIHLVRNIMDSVSYSYSDGKNILTLTRKI